MKTYRSVTVVSTKRTVLAFTGSFSWICGKFKAFCEFSYRGRGDRDLAASRLDSEAVCATSSGHEPWNSQR